MALRELKGFTTTVVFCALHYDTARTTYKNKPQQISPDFKNTYRDKKKFFAPHCAPKSSLQVSVFHKQHFFIALQKETVTIGNIV
ncbi:MAG: hypothetical protein KTR20_10880 [Cellvibrionaceae bacterium]|nr:hypothetical protein [Cellvibrionaceae bacterium]